MQQQDWGLREELAGLAQAIKEAREEWEAARLFFAEVTEPDLVDQAIYRLEVAERRYMYLWKIVRQQWQAAPGTEGRETVCATFAETPALPAKSTAP